jgi:plastocyanin
MVSWNSSFTALYRHSKMIRKIILIVSISPLFLSINWSAPSPYILNQAVFAFQFSNQQQEGQQHKIQLLSSSNNFSHSVANTNATGHISSLQASQIGATANMAVEIVFGAALLGNISYYPNPLVASPNTTIVWHNTDEILHTVTSGLIENNIKGKEFDSSIILPDMTYVHTFSEIGEYPYFCILHPAMAGKIIIVKNETYQQTNQSAPPPSQQQQQIGQQPPPQSTQTSPPPLAQQNTTQLNQSAPQQIAPLNQLVGSEDFAASGTINSTLYTTNGNWEAIGIWTLSVSEGEVTSFDTDMAWNNGTSAHTHEFHNFEMDEDSDDISIDSEGGITIEGGVMDVGTNGVVSWPNVPAEISIQQGKIITVSVDHEETNNHFGGQSVHGIVTSLTPCSASPGANMQIPTGGC